MHAECIQICHNSYITATVPFPLVLDTPYLSLLPPNHFHAISAEYDCPYVSSVRFISMMVLLHCYFATVVFKVPHNTQTINVDRDLLSSCPRVCVPLCPPPTTSWLCWVSPPSPGPCTRACTPCWPPSWPSSPLPSTTASRPTCSTADSPLQSCRCAGLIHTLQCLVYRVT